MGFVIDLAKDVFTAAKETISARRKNKWLKKHPKYRRKEQEPLFDDFGDMVFTGAKGIFDFIVKDFMGYDKQSANNFKANECTQSKESSSKSNTEKNTKKSTANTKSQEQRSKIKDSTNTKKTEYSHQESEKGSSDYRDTAKEYSECEAENIDRLAEKYYKVLNLSYDDDLIKIKKSFRSFCQIYHPDKHSDMKEEEVEILNAKFCEIKEAYDYLIEFKS